jgi:hypothetical protein
MTKTTSINRYPVQPLLVTDLTSQCAAHFLNWFSKRPNSVIRGVKEIGMNGVGGWIDQVDAWFDLCEAGGVLADDGREHWNTEQLGPWVYEHVAVADVAETLLRHIRGWGVTSISAYGRLASQETKVDDPAPS